MTTNRIVNHLKKAKLARRRELAKLSFPEKILILIRLQKMVDGINQIKGRRRIVVWKL
jgi:hypothetical protein